MKTWTRRLFDIDQWLVFFLLAVTVNQMGHYLATFQPPGFAFIGYLQAAGIDLAIWRSAWWFKKYHGRKQRRWALVGVALFSVVSACYNARFYAMRSLLLPWLMGAILPAGVALLSFLYGQKDESQFATSRLTAQDSESETLDAIPPPVDLLMCDQCSRVFAWPGDYDNRRAAQNALNAHTRAHRNGKQQIRPAPEEVKTP
jgi:hypothetical protein